MCRVSLPERIEVDPARFAQHNAEQREVWQAFHAGRPIRVPCVIGTNVRIIIQDPALNPWGVTFEEYTRDPDTMLRMQIVHWLYARQEYWVDHEMGPPAGGWTIGVDFQNFYEAAWLGSPVSFRPGNCPYAEPWLTDDNRNAIFDRGIPDPFADGGWMARNWEYFDYFSELKRRGQTFVGLPIQQVVPSAMGTDGPFTVAAELRGGDIAADMLAEPEYFHRLMDFITEATIRRMHAYRRRMGLPERTRDFGYADDSIAMLSVSQFRDHVLPYHRRLVEALWDGTGRLRIHLCGDVQRHLPVLHEQLGARLFDTGYPIDLHEVRRQVGPDTILQGGPTVQLLQTGPEGRITEVCRRLLEGPAARDGLFVMREANNLAPRTPPAHVRAMYEACRRYGRLDG